MEVFIYKIKEVVGRKNIKHICSYLSWSDWKIISCAKLSNETIFDFADNLDWYHVGRVSDLSNIPDNLKYHIECQLSDANMFRQMDDIKIDLTKCLENGHDISTTPFKYKKIPDDLYFILPLNLHHWTNILDLYIGNKSMSSKKVFPDNFGNVRQWMLFSHDDDIIFHKYNQILFLLVDCDVATNGRIACGFVNAAHCFITIVFDSVSEYVDAYNVWEDSISRKHDQFIQHMIIYIGNKLAIQN